MQQEYTGQRASKAPKYRVLMDWLDQRADEAAAAKATNNAGLLQQPCNNPAKPCNTHDTTMTQPCNTHATGVHRPDSLRGPQEYTGQTASEAPKYRALMDWLDLRADQGAASNATGPTGLLQQRRALCLSLDVGVQGGVAGTAGGGVWLGEGMLLGAPAGHTYLVSWLSGLANASSQPLDITLWQSTDCTNTSTQQLQRPVTQALLVLAARAVPVSPPGQLAWRVPLPEENPALSALVATSPQKPSFFLRISDGLTTNYSEPFSIQAPYAYVTATSPPAIPSPATSPSALYQTSMDLVLHAVDVEALTSSPAAKKALLQAIATATSIPLADLTLAAISFPVDATLKLTGVSLLAPATTQLLSTLQAALAKVLGLSQSEVDVQLVAASALMSSRRLSAEVKVAGSRQLLQGTGDVSVSLRVLGISSQPGSSTQLMVSLTTALEQGGGLATELLQQAGSGGIGSFIVSTPPAVVAVVRVSGPEMVLANSQAWAAAASEAMTSGAMADALLASPELAGATATMDQMTMAMVGLPPPLDPQPASSTDASASPSTTVGGAPSTSTSTSAVAPWVVAVASVCGALVLALIVVATVALVASHRKRRGVISPRCHSVTGGHRVFPLQMEDDISKAKL
eukprot:gene27886-12003_t